MKMKRFCALLTLCLLASIVWAADITFVAGTDNGNSDGSAHEFFIVKDGITIVVSNGLANSSQYRIYRGQTATFTSAIGPITQIVFECTAEGEAQYGPGCLTAAPGEYSYSGKIGTWVGQSAYVVFTAASNQVRATKITVTVGDAGLMAPSITPTAGTYYSPIQVAISCPTSGAKIYYTTNGSDPTTSSTQFTTPFTLSSNTTVKAISAKDGEVSDVVSAVYEFGTATQVDNIAAYKDVPDDTVVVFKNPVNVLAQSQSKHYLYVKDNSGYTLIYSDCGQTYVNGDVIPSGFAGTKKTDNGEPELADPLLGFQPASGNSPIAPTTPFTANQVSHATFANYVSMDEVTFTKDGNNYTLTDASGNTCAVYFGTMGVSAPSDLNAKYDVIGVIGSDGNENTVYQLLPTCMKKHINLGEGFGFGSMFDTPDNEIVTFENDVTVIWQGGHNNNYLYAFDSTGFGMVYGNVSNTYHFGDIIPAGFGGKKTTYKGEPELVTIGTGQPLPGFQPAIGSVTPTPEVITPAEVNHDHWAHYVLLKNVMINPEGTIITQNGATCEMYNKTFNITMPEDLSVPHDVYGIVGVFNNYQVLPISFDVAPMPLENEGYDFIVDGIAYKVTDDNTVKVTYIDLEENYPGLMSIQVPESVGYEGVIYQVNAIGEYAFWGCPSLSTLIIPPCVSSIASNAFSVSTLNNVYVVGSGDWQAGAIPIHVQNLYIGSGITSIRGLKVNPSAIYSFAAVPPECDDNTFLGYNAVLHVPGASFTDYFMADYWCNFADIRNDAVEPTNVVLSNNEAELMMGDAITLTATVSPNNATPNSVVWITSNPQVAVVSDGVVSPMSEGECDIVATCLDKRAVCHVTVTNPITVTLDQTEVIIEQTNQVTLTATVTPDWANSEEIIWTTSNADVATVNDGVVTAVGLGECNITASYLDKQAVCHVTVIETTIYITLDQHEASVLPNHMITITPTVFPLTTTLKATSSNPNVAVARLVNGVVQVAGKAKGTTLIIVGSMDDMAVPDTCVVTVYTETGDVNSDGFVDIDDVTELISIVLNGNSGDDTSPDVNGDERVDIDDITTLINYVLVGRWPWEVSLNESFSEEGVEFKGALNENEKTIAIRKIAAAL